MTVSPTGDTTAFQWHREIDISREVCPMTFVRTRLALDRMAPGQILRVVMQGAEPVANIPRTAIEQGHAVLAIQSLEDGRTCLLLQRG